MSKRLCSSLILVVALCIGCAPAEPPVGDLAIAPEAITMSYPQALRVALNWKMIEPLAEVTGAPRVFLHLIDGSGDVVRTYDHDLGGSWSAGEELSYEVVLSESALVPALPEGQYALTAGLYDASGKRWPLAVRGEEVHPQEYRIATVTATSEANAPQFFFSAEWLPLEGGTDLQVLARRWLAEDGVLRLSEIPAAGTLYLRIGIPKGIGGQEIVLEAEGTEPAVHLTTTCGDFEAAVTGPGSHVVTLPVAVLGEENACDISFSSNYYLLSKDNLSRRTMALENLSWLPGE